MSYCGEQTAVKNEGHGLVAISLKCNSWLCPNCTDNRKRQLVAQGFGGSPNKFITLTHRNDGKYTAEECAKRLSWAWRVCRKRLMRKYKWKKLPFLAVIEKHKSGWPHIHILARARFIPWLDISNIMKELIDSPRVRVEAIQSEKQCMGYCVKYCGKAAEKFQCAKRYWQSRDYDLRDPPEPKDKHVPGFGWEMWSTPLHHWVAGEISLGNQVTWEGAHKAISIPWRWWEANASSSAGVRE